MGLSQMDRQPQRAPGLQEMPAWAPELGQQLHFQGQAPARQDPAPPAPISADVKLSGTGPACSSHQHNKMLSQ